MNQAECELVWRRRAAALVRRLNLAWWLERFNTLALAGLLAFAAVLLVARTVRVTWARPLPVGIALAGWIFLIAVAAWWLVRGKFVDARAGLVRLEDRLALHNRLTSASAGIGPWPGTGPGAAAAAAAGLSWNPVKAWLPGAAALTLVAAAWWVPLPRPARELPPAVEPGAWERMEDWIETLSAEELVEEEALEEAASRIEELRDRPEEEWFRHSSLEATDTLEAALGREIRDLAEAMNTLERNLAALQGGAVPPGTELEQKLAKEIQEALEALGDGGLPLDESLMRQLGEIDPARLAQSTLGKLTPGQLEALRERLREGAATLGSLEGLPTPEPGAMPAEGLAGPGGAGGEPGRGGISRGRGDAPLAFDDREDDLGTSNLESVGNDDLSRAVPGEVLGLGETERELDKSAAGPVAGGAPGSTGRGGEAVSRETLLPDEQAVLKRYFK